MSTTINNGLKYVRGEYLLWPDADDWFDDDTTITSMVYVLNNHPEYSCVRVMANYVDEITMTKTPIAIQNKSKEDLFEDFYYWNNNIWAPAGSHMIRTAKLFSELTDRSILQIKTEDRIINYYYLYYIKSMLYYTKHIYNILVRNGSHSRGAYANYSHQIKRWYDSVELIIHTINNISSMDNQTKIWYSAMTHQRYYLIMANTAKRHHKPIEYFRFIIKYFLKNKILINCSL